jgi:hypothetical protein
MSIRKTIVVNGLLAAIPLALIGYLYAQMAGMWVSSQAIPRTGTSGSLAAASSISAAEISSAIAWRLPFTMAICGFIFVALGEGAKSLWSYKSNQANEEGRVQLDHTSEVETQRILKNHDAEETLANNPGEPVVASESLFEVEELVGAGNVGASHLHN